jgi:hypothetical protein
MSILDQLGMAPGDPAQHFQRVASEVPRSALSSMLGNIFQSQETGSFGQNVSQMYAQSNPLQQAGILNTLIRGAGPGILSSLGINLPGLSNRTQLTPEQAQQVTPAHVEHIANQAQRQNPGIVQEAGEFYSQHPQLVQALGAGAAMWALQHFRK